MAYTAIYCIKESHKKVDSGILFPYTKVFTAKFLSKWILVYCFLTQRYILEFRFCFPTKCVCCCVLFGTKIMHWYIKIKVDTGICWYNQDKDQPILLGQRQHVRADTSPACES